MQLITEDILRRISKASAEQNTQGFIHLLKIPLSDASLCLEPQQALERHKRLRASPALRSPPPGKFSDTLDSK